MKWQVTWTAPAQRELAEIWSAARDRQRLTEAVDRFDRSAEQDPRVDTDRYGNQERIAFAGPLAIVFRIIDEESAVHVIDVFRYPG
ncbi:type II toxin-antitoxin system RelE/ParE family toxin [Stratiformator vulcanicus]|uniref:Plasmid stabilization system protein n=1 Tax=Stratiformator vulcanicus TaxID=2527980 RepID=A0A517QZ99_9PLAN|nr:type II toxin-antitoxin system RelE/ParE family toxin [Stratiformator vulcanicus]QDT36976.1 hypothetical protein Pan189_13400 [Stratiformator vulcanicus]